MLGWSALTTAIAFLPAGLFVAIFATRIGPLVDRFGTAKLIVVGSTALLAGYLVFLRGVDEDPNVGSVVLPAMLLLGMAWLAFPALNIQAVAGVKDEEQGLASGLLNTSFQVGGAVVLAIVTAALTSNGGVASLDGIRTGIAVSALFAVAGLAVSLSGLWPRPAEEPAVAATEVLERV
jgi:MFS family permease